MTNIKPIGERIAIINTEEAYEGKIALPESRTKSHVHGKCVAVGSGKYPDGTTKEIYTKVGDVYLYQIDGAQQVNASFKIDNQLVLLLHQADMICRLNDKTVSFDTIDMMGDRIKIVPQRQINSYDYDQYPGSIPHVYKKDLLGNDGQWAPGDFLIHWPGIGLDRRIPLAEQMLTQVIK